MLQVLPSSFKLYGLSMPLFACSIGAIRTTYCEHYHNNYSNYEENPLPYGNWTTHDGNNFFCEWYDDCPPCKDSIRGPRLPGGGSWQEEDEDGLGLGHPDADDFVHY